MRLHMRILISHIHMRFSSSMATLMQTGVYVQITSQSTSVVLLWTYLIAISLVLVTAPNSVEDITPIIR